MTGKDVYNNALILLDEVDSETGDLNENAGYAAKAPKLINMLQREIARAEGVETSKVTSLDDELVISDDSAERILAYGLAAKLALADKLMEFHVSYQNTYDERFRQIGVRAEDFVDDQKIMRGF